MLPETLENEKVTRGNTGVSPTQILSDRQEVNDVAAPTEPATAPHETVSNPSVVPPTQTDTPIKPISELIADPNFPQSALGQMVDIGGFSGVVTEIVRNSIKVRPKQGLTMSYNVNVLRRLYGPRPKVEIPNPQPSVAEEKPAVPAGPRREVIENPDFGQPLESIEAFVERPDFPRCTFGRLVDLRGYVGVVVELVGHSLKIRSPEGITRSYNAETLTKIYGKGRSSPG